MSLDNYDDLDNILKKYLDREDFESSYDKKDGKKSSDISNKKKHKNKSNEMIEEKSRVVPKIKRPQESKENTTTESNEKISTEPMIKIPITSDSKVKKMTVAERKRPSDAERRRPSDVERKRPSDVERRKSSESERKRPSDAEGRRPSDAEGRRPSDAEGRRPSDAEGRRPSDAERKRPSDAERKRPSDVDRRSSEPERKRPTDFERRKTSNANELIKQKQTNKSTSKLFRVLFFVFIICLLVVIYNIVFNQVKKKVTLELGSTLSISDVVNYGESKADFVSEEELLLLEELGVYTIQINKKNKIYDVRVEVIDTIAPIGESISVTLSKALDIQPEQCVTNAVDASEITYSFKNPIDMTSMEEQEIIVNLEDAAGNSTDIKSYITLSSDTVAPVFEGDDIFESPLDEGVSYKKIITVTDDSGEDVTLDIDNSLVDVTTEGDYKVIYTATDHVGNVSVKEIVIRIYKKSQSQALVEERAETIIADIINDSMSDEKKATAIFYWVRENVAFTNSTIRNSWVDGAYAGLVNKAGDCYVYAMTTKVLLDTANIVNMDIEKIPTSTEHFWNLVDVGDGWIHLDTTRRKDGTLICLWNDNKLISYSNANSKSHNYDASEYPTIN